MAPVEHDEEDLTRKQRREQARAQRKELEEAETAKAVRRTRLTQLGIVVAIVVIAIVVIAIAAGGGGGNKGTGKLAATHSKEESQVVREVTSLVGGIPQSGNVLGSPSAPVTLVYFGDLECPVCKQFTLGALKPVIEKWVRPGKLRIEYRALETATREPEVFKVQQVAALAAGKQNLMWHYIELFYHEQGAEDTGYVTESYLQGLAHQVPGLNFATWSEQRKDPQFENSISTDAQAANNQGFNGTPSFLIGRTGSPPHKMPEVSLTDPSGFNEQIEKELKK
jgi:protein-disulfide isomerase